MNASVSMYGKFPPAKITFNQFIHFLWIVKTMKLNYFMRIQINLGILRMHGWILEMLVRPLPMLYWLARYIKDSKRRQKGARVTSPDSISRKMVEQKFTLLIPKPILMRLIWIQVTEWAKDRCEEKIMHFFFHYKSSNFLSSFDLGQNSQKFIKDNYFLNRILVVFQRFSVDIETPSVVLHALQKEYIVMRCAVTFLSLKNRNKWLCRTKIERHTFRNVLSKLFIFNSYQIQYQLSFLHQFLSGRSSIKRQAPLCSRAAVSMYCYYVFVFLTSILFRLAWYTCGYDLPSQTLYPLTFAYSIACKKFIFSIPSVSLFCSVFFFVLMASLFFFERNFINYIQCFHSL